MILSSCGEPTPLVTSSSLGGHGDSANKAGLKSKAKKQSNQAGIRKKTDHTFKYYKTLAFCPSRLHWFSRRENINRHGTMKLTWMDLTYSLALHFLRGIYSGVLIMIVHRDSEPCGICWALSTLLSSAVVWTTSHQLQAPMLGGREQNLIWTRPLQTPGHRVCHTRVEKDNLVAATFESCCQHCRFLGYPVARTCPQGWWLLGGGLAVWAWVDSTSRTTLLFKHLWAGPCPCWLLIGHKTWKTIVWLMWLASNKHPVRTAQLCSPLPATAHACFINTLCMVLWAQDLSWATLE